jgi:hypothetical protein
MRWPLVQLSPIARICGPFNGHAGILGCADYSYHLAALQIGEPIDMGGMDAMKSNTDVARGKPLVCMLLLLFGSVVGRAVAADEVTPTFAVEGRNDVTVVIDRVEPYRFSKPHNEPRGIKVVLADFTSPNRPTPDTLIEVFCSAQLSAAMAKDWEIVRFIATEIGDDAKSTHRAETFYVIPSECNNFCNNAKEYAITQVRPDRRYRVEYLLWPRNSHSNAATTMASLRTSNQDAQLSLKVWYEFAEPYSKIVRDAARRNRVDSAGIGR